MINFEDHFIKLHLYNPLIGHKTFQYSPKDSVSDLRSTVCQTTELMMYENFHFQHQNKVLSEFLEMGETLTSGAKINIIFNSFDERSSKFHYLKVKNILENPTILVNHNTTYDQVNAKKQPSIPKPKISDSIDTFLQSLQRQELLEVKTFELQHNFSEWLNLSGFNPVPYYRKFMGDHYYLYFKSPDEQDFHITAHSEGFFLNQSTNTHFNPNPSTKHSKVFISLLDLLYTISPKFKELFRSTIAKIKQTSEGQKFMIGPLLQKKQEWLKEKKLTSQQTSINWKVCPLERTIKKDEILSIKDWNEMFQIQHLEPSSNLYDKINRQKIKFKIHQQFVDHARLGAVSIVDRQIPPMNPNCEKKDQTFLFTNIYFSFVDNSFQEKDLTQLAKKDISQVSTTKTSGKSRQSKSSKSVNNYILTLQTLDNGESMDLHLSHSVLIQYKGQKLHAQSFPSSLIHTKPKSQSITDLIQQRNCINLSLPQNAHNLTNRTLDSSYLSESLIKLAYRLNLQHDSVVRCLDDENKVVKKVSISTQLKCVETPDKKKYIFGLNALLAKDYNFFQGKDLQNSHHANLDTMTLRPQLIALYNQKFKCRIPINPMLGKSLSKKYEPILNEKLKQEQKKLKSMAQFAKDNVIAMVLAALQGDSKKHLADTKNVIDIMHKYGLNVRYLGLMYKKIDPKKAPNLLVIVQKIIYVKSLKNIINTALKAVSPSNSKALIAHMLNCIFYPQRVISDDYVMWKSSRQEQIQQQMNNELVKKKKKKNKDREKEDSLLTLSLQEGGEFFLTIKPKELDDLIRKMAKLKFCHEFESEIVKPKIFTYLYGRISVLRDLCLHTGIMLQKRSYFTETSQKTSLFLPEHINSFLPRCTHTNPQKKQLDQLIAQGDNFLSQFFVEESIESYNKAIQYILTTFGGNNEKLPLIHKKLSFIYFKIGDIETALLFGSHSLGMFEEFYGMQHVETIDNLAMLGIYHCAERNFVQAEQCMFKALYYGYVAFSQLYPEILTMWLDLSTIYEIQKRFPQAIMCLYTGLQLCIKIFSQLHLNTAIYYAALSSLHLQIPDILQSIRFKQKSLSILQKLLPQNDMRIKESAQILEYLKSLQSSKKIKQIHEKQLRKLQNSAFGYHPPQMGGWEYNGGRNGRGNVPGGIMMGFGGRGFGKMQEYFFRQTEQYWRRTAYGGKRMK